MSVVNNNLLLTADAGVAPSAYQIQRSLRFNSADSATLSRTPSVAGNQKTWTWAAWVKLDKVPTGYPVIFQAGYTSAPWTALAFYPDGVLSPTYSAGASDGSLTSAKYRDLSAWYHIVWATDTTQATASDRCKLYVNGVLQSFSSTNYPSQNFDTRANSIVSHTLGGWPGQYFTGYLADIHFIDGQALTPSSFTETNATTGQLVPKAYTGSYGTNGFRLNFSDNSAATAATLGADSSGNGNNWTPNNLSVANSFLGGNNGTLVNGPTYNSANGGSIVF